MTRPFFTPGKDPVPIVQEAGWAPGSVWTGAEISFSDPALITTEEIQYTYNTPNFKMSYSFPS